MAEAMSDKRLAEIRQTAADSRAVVARHLTAALNELLAEHDRQRDELAGAHAQLRTELAISKLLLRDKDELIMRAHHAEVRAETAERELAEMRKQHQPGPALHAWRRPDGRCVHGEQDWIRESVHVYGGEHVSMQTCSHQGEWKPAEQQPEDGDRG